MYHLLNYQTENPFYDLVTWDHGVRVSLPRSGTCVTGLVAISHDELSKSVSLSQLNPCEHSWT